MERRGEFRDLPVEMRRVSKYDSEPTLLGIRARNISREISVRKRFGFETFALVEERLDGTVENINSRPKPRST